ncbi:uncharacterized protein LOC142577825 [Dermacentor variabilis]|uniref:uncharacterized protein LOC142577825 n=1 Tax=Dermacentor variabilis TaxID=34621 RepID=UPI003F5C533A
MYLGCSVVLTGISCLCRKFEIFVLVMSPYDTVGCCGAKDLVYLKGRLDNPEFSANAVSRFVGFSIIDSLLTGFKGILVMRLFELYDDLSRLVDLMALLHKQQQHAAAVSAQVATPVETPKYLPATT